MTDKIDASVSKAIDKLMSGAETVVSKVTALGEKYGPEVVDAGLTVVRLNGLKDLIVGLVFLTCAASLVVLARYLFRRSGREKGDARDGCIAVGCVVSVVAAFGIGGAAERLLDIWTYTAIIEPKLWVAKRLLGL